MPNKKCKYCGKEFNGISEYQLNEKLKRHDKDTHEIYRVKDFPIKAIPT